MEYANIIGPVTDPTISPAASESKPRELVRISEKHRRLARLIAEGVEQTEAAIATGYNVARVSVLMSDPSFKELVAFYRGIIDNEFSSVQKKIAEVTGLAAQEVATRLVAAPDSWKNEELLRIVEKGADRIGYAPKTNVEAGNTTVYGDLVLRMERAQERLRQSPKVIEAEPVEDGCID